VVRILQRPKRLGQIFDSDKAAESLGKITPDASCYPEAQTLADEIKSNSRKMVKCGTSK